MSPIYFHAQYLTNLREFKVEIRFTPPSTLEGKPQRFIEFMDIKRFLSWADSLPQGMSIGGNKIEFVNGPEAYSKVVGYFQAVASSYRASENRL